MSVAPTASVASPDEPGQENRKMEHLLYATYQVPIGRSAGIRRNRKKLGLGLLDGHAVAVVGGPGAEEEDKGCVAAKLERGGLVGFPVFGCPPSI